MNLQFVGEVRPQAEIQRLVVVDRVGFSGFLVGRLEERAVYSEQEKAVCLTKIVVVVVIVVETDVCVADGVRFLIAFPRKMDGEEVM